MRFELNEIAADSDHSGLFPAPGGGKIIATRSHLFLTFGAKGGGSVVMRFDGNQSIRSPILPSYPPYLTVDSKGFLHVAGLHQKQRDKVFYYHSKEPFAINAFSEGESIHPKNYSSLAIHDRDDSLFYFGAGISVHGIGFRRRSEGRWAERSPLVEGHLIYPGVCIRDGIIHLMFSGWDAPAAIYENVFYMRSRDGGKTWQRNNGQPIDVPFSYDPAEVDRLALLDRVSRTLEQGHPESNTHNLHLMADRAGRPHLLYAYVPAYFPTLKPVPRVGIVHARGERSGWKYSLLNSEPSVDVGGATMCEGRDGRLHCILGYRLPGRKFFDLGYVSSDDAGDHWSRITPITKDADRVQASYSYPHLAAEQFQEKFWFVVNRSGGGPLFIGSFS